jgi:diacylglycerol kinase family enzyme
LQVYTQAAQGVRVYETRSLEELDRAVREMEPMDVVVLAGGDGSYSAGVTALQERFGADTPAIALAPGGTVSTVARNWGMRSPRARYANDLLARIRTGRFETIERPTLRVDDGTKKRSGFIFGAGLVANFFSEYYASHRRGYLGAAAIVAPIFAGSFVGGALAKRVLEPVPCALTIDGVPAKARAFSLVCASVVRDLGLHMLVTYRAAESFDRFHAIASPLGTRALGPQMPRVLMGKRLRGDDHIDDLISKMTIEFENGGAFVLDGDLIRAKRVAIHAGPRLRVLA